MSDGATDGYRYIRAIFNQYLEQFVNYLEFFPKVKNDADAIHLCHTEQQLKQLAHKISDFSSEVLSRDWRLPKSLCDRLLQDMAVGNLPPLEVIFLALFFSQEYTLLIRLQKVTDYRDRLIIFADEKHRVAENGVHYASDRKFVDGDQDIMLGIAKKRFGVDIKKGEPFMITAHWNHIRKRWHLCNMFQF